MTHSFPFLLQCEVRERLIISFECRILSNITILIGEVEFINYASVCCLFSARFEIESEYVDEFQFYHLSIWNLLIG